MMEPGGGMGSNQESSKKISGHHRGITRIAW